MTTLILSDLHLGPGRDPHTGLYSPLESFFADHAFAAFLHHYAPLTTDNCRLTTDYCHPTTLVLAGDTFTLSENPTPPSANLERPDLEAAHYLHTIAAGHPIFFDALRNWLANGNRLVILPGNHDFELAFSHPQSALRQLLTANPQSPTCPERSRRISNIQFTHFHHDQPARLYVEHSDRYCLPRQPGRPPWGYRRDRYVVPVLKTRVPGISNLPESYSYYMSLLFARDPLAMLVVLPRLRAFLTAKIPDLPRERSDNVTLHTINLALIEANWHRAQALLRRATWLGVAKLALGLAAAALPGAGLTFLALGRIALGTTLFGAAGLARALSTDVTRRAEEILATDLPRTAAREITPNVARAGVRTLVFGHSHRADHAQFHLADGTSAVNYFNCGTWIRTIDPLSLVPLPTQTYVLVDDDNTPRLLQWTDRGPQQPIIIQRRN